MQKANGEASQSRLTASAHGYFFGGAGTESTLRENQSAYEHIQFRPRVLVDVSIIDTSVTRKSLPRLPFPLLIAPVAMQRLANPAGELAVARAAAKFQVPMIVSMMSTVSMEDIAQVGGMRFLQLYVLKDRALTLRLVNRAYNAGYSAIVLTVDTPRYGRRARDDGNAFTLPDGLVLANLQGEISLPKSKKSALTAFGEKYLDDSLSYKDLTWLIRNSPLPVWVKGVVRADDARLAVDAGAAVVVVSNHGGRQLDGTIAPITAVEEVVKVVGKQVPVLVDSGIRNPEDVVRARALGADAVLLGRPVISALAENGETGVENLLEHFRNGIRLTMALCGAPSCKDIVRNMVITEEDRIANAVRVNNRSKL